MMKAFALVLAVASIGHAAMAQQPDPYTVALARMTAQAQQRELDAVAALIVAERALAELKAKAATPPAPSVQP